MNRKSFKIFIAATAAVVLAACGERNSWTVDGRIEGADNKTLILEASSNGRWYPLDTVTLTGGGNFKFTHEAAGYPDIYRLRLNDRSLYFPIDSIETVTVVARADAFDTDYTLSGSTHAVQLMTVEQKLQDAASHLGAATATDSILKRELAGELLNDPSGIVAYYIINKKIGGRSLFDPANKGDLRIIGAVANAFHERRPGDPRTAYLTQLFTSNHANNRPAVSSAATDTIMAAAIGVLDIQLYDDKGTLHSLAEECSKGHPVILNFTSYTAEASPAVNLALNKVYEQYASRGLQIFQVAFDADEYAWKQSARNLPWITVYNSAHDGTEALMKYNVGSLPATFVIGADGEIKSRVDNLAELNAAVARAF